MRKRLGFSPLFAGTVAKAAVIQSDTRKRPDRRTKQAFRLRQVTSIY